MMKITTYGENLFHLTSRILFFNFFIGSTYMDLYLKVLNWIGYQQWRNRGVLAGAMAP
jgi:hypothetical protein